MRYVCDFTLYIPYGSISNGSRCVCPVYRSIAPCAAGIRAVTAPLTFAIETVMLMKTRRPAGNHDRVTVFSQ